ncbi:MAG TPA: hypothetical protein VL084_14640 [Thermoanaerobaculia bacterium]|nr:hypothetical protein [Thermoanaerobaculia bacterium]
MSEEKKEIPAPQPRTVCAVCGRDESGMWHWSKSLGRLVCAECYRDGDTPPPNTPAVKKP